LAQQAKLARAEEIRKELEFCNRIAAERAHSRHKKHFESCKDILGQIVDLATKVGEYRQLTGRYVACLIHFFCFISLVKKIKNIKVGLNQN